MKAIGLVFPHQLFEENPLLGQVEEIYLIEEDLFFTQYPFHQQKLVLHRASMKEYAAYLTQKKKQVHYIEANQSFSDVRLLIQQLKKEGASIIHYINTTDNWLEKRLTNVCREEAIILTQHTSPLFLNTTEENESFFEKKKRMFQTDYYIHQRKTRSILLDKEGNAVGGQWSYDAQNREKYPKGKTPPTIPGIKKTVENLEAENYVSKHFSHHYGALSGPLVYPVNFLESKSWLEQFLEQRFVEFGPYEDAIVGKELLLHHSLLTPMMNVGLLTPAYVVERTLAFAEKNNTPLASVEGFIRQIIGWREFIRAVYERKGTEERTKNYWGFTEKIPESFWNGTTGIVPIDQTIKKVIDTGYCHHIERLMILGNFMLLCEFDPDEVYKWFMVMFIDAYDWVMVPNVYGMSQFADGGIMATKPYISGSNYVLKMSDYKKGDWCAVWDALFWNFMHTRREFFLSNPRLGMLVRTYDKMEERKRKDMDGLVKKFRGNGFRL
jgi:deoxyribodipyrimidine photolyase-related protein